jgi:hypothetical protein
MEHFCADIRDRFDISLPAFTTLNSSLRKAKQQRLSTKLLLAEALLASDIIFSSRCIYPYFSLECIVTIIPPDYSGCCGL